MMTDDVALDFVLVRGPALLDRRLHVRLPGNGTPVTVGRAPHCTVLLDPSLLFASQVHCSVFAIRTKAAATASPAPPLPSSLSGSVTSPPRHDEQPPSRTATAPDSPGGAEAAGTQSAELERTPSHQSTAHAEATHTVKVYVTDMCSSNGTFVNGLRISGTDPTELQHGDVCIFGGMRDVEEGEALPADAYAGPELVQWRVDLRPGQRSTTHEFAFTATPLILPAQPVLAAEMRALMDTALRSLPKPRRDWPVHGGAGGLSVTPAAHGQGRLSAMAGGAEEEGGSSSSCGRRRDADSPVGVPQQLFASPASPVAAEKEEEEEEREARGDHTAVRADAGEVAEGGEEALVVSTPRRGGGEKTRSVSLVMTPPAIESEVAAAAAAALDPVRPADPPAAVLYTAVRLGNVSFVPCPPPPAAVGDTVAAGGEDGGEANGPPAKRARADADVRADGGLAAAPQKDAMPVLTCTSSHLKWTMANPNHLLAQQQQQQRQGEGDGAAADASALAPQPSLSFFGMLAVTSLSTVLACPARCGLAVELRDGCQLPLVDAAVLSGPAESRWVVWTLSAAMEAPAAASGAGQGSAAKKKKKAGGRGGAGAATPQPAEEAPAMASTPADRFEAWLRHFELFYGAQGVPAPHRVDAATFDLIFAPPVSPVTPSA